MRASIASPRMVARSSGAIASAGGAIKGAVVAFFGRRRRQPQAVNLLGCHGKACKGRLAPKIACERFHVLKERQEHVRAARVVVADVQHLGWAIVAGKFFSKSILVRRAFEPAA